MKEYLCVGGPRHGTRVLGVRSQYEPTTANLETTIFGSPQRSYSPYTYLRWMGVSRNNLSVVGEAMRASTDEMMRVIANSVCVTLG